MKVCASCHKPLVEVENPIRREVRHRRGEEVLCEAWRADAGLAPLTGMRCINCGKPMSAHGAMAECWPDRALSDPSLSDRVQTTESDTLVPNSDG